MGLSFSLLLWDGRTPLRRKWVDLRDASTILTISPYQTSRRSLLSFGPVLLALFTSLAYGAKPPSSSSLVAELPAVSTLGSDVSDLPTSYPEANWLPLEGPARAMEPRVQITVNGKQVSAVLDTGAMTSLMSRPMAERLGLRERIGKSKSVTLMDSHGATAMGHRVAIPEVSLQKHKWKDVEFLVFGDQRDLLLIGADLLQDVDILLAAEEGWVGLFDGGSAPIFTDEVVIPVQRKRRQLSVEAFAHNTRKSLIPFTLVIDTGATHTSVPAWVGINNGLPADLTYTVQTISVGGAQEARGRFVLDPLFLGPAMQNAGRVLALPSTIQNGEGEAMLGNDVLLRNRTLISFQKEEIRIVYNSPRPAYRILGPAGVRCETSSRPHQACLEVRLDTPEALEARPDALPGICLAVDAAPVYAGQSLELTITALDDSGRDLFAGGVLRALVTIGPQGLQKCFPLWPHLAHLGLRADSRLSLRWVRGEGFRWPCDAEQSECLAFTGPMSHLPTKSSLSPEITGGMR